MFVVIESTPGYMPEDDDPATFEDLADARVYASDRLSSLYGGWSLETMAEDGSSGVHVVFPTSSKRELYDRMRAYIEGLQARRVPS